jgi:hypothetical protein
MRREPVATTETRYVRVLSNILTNIGFLYSLSDCSGSRMDVARGFAQSSPFNVEIHGVIGGQ